MTSDKDIRGFDFHCHVDLHPDPAALIARCEQERIVVLAVTTTPRAWPQNRLWTMESSYVHAAVGLHPEVVGKRYSEIDLLEQHIGDSRLVGEIGLDGSPQHQASYNRQKEVFERALRASQRHRGRIATIHSRRAAADTIEMIQRHTNPADVLCILHWFSGSVTDAMRGAEAGCYFSVNAAMLTHERGRALVRNIPKDRVLTETDSPFVEIDGRKPGPTDVPGVVAELSALYSEHVSETKEQVTKNARRVWQFAGEALGS